MHTSPEWLRFKDNAREAEFYVRYHVRAQKNTRLLMVTAGVLHGLAAMFHDNSLPLLVLLYSGFAGGWFIVGWRVFHRFAQTVAPALVGLFFVGVDFLLVGKPDFLHGGTSFLAGIYVFIAYTMLRFFFVPSVFLGLFISFSHVFLLYQYGSDEGTIYRAATILFVINVLGAMISLRFESNFRRMFLAKSEFMEEKAEQDLLLNNVLPKSVGERLRENFEDVVIFCPDVIILSADLANFTAYSSSVTAQQLVSFLNKIYSEFDLLADQYGLMKIKTLGDAILLASGIQGDTDPESCLRMAVSMRDTLQRIARETGAPVDIRIGLASGSCHAGVIGESRPKFDVWGPAVKAAEIQEKRSRNGEISVDARVSNMVARDESLKNVRWDNGADFLSTERTVA
jgi:class 3 adenylate cyclase